jgi:hypothetical protein
MSTRRISLLFNVAVLAAGGLAAIAAPSASAQSCPDVEVLFARGTDEPPGVGPTGQAFVNTLRSRVGGKSFGVYPVHYPASREWDTGVDGVKDAATHVLSMAGSCPATQMVLGGYSQGAAVMGFVTSAAVPDGIDPATVPKPLQPEVADHVASVVLFGTPNERAMDFLGQPQVVIGPLYEAKTIKLCVTEDPVCSDGMNFAAHNTYAEDGSMVNRGAAFAASRLDASPGWSVSPPAQSPPPAQSSPPFGEPPPEELPAEEPPADEPSPDESQAPESTRSP